MPKSIAPLLVILFVNWLPTTGFGQSCPKVLACPGGNTIVCDVSDNDTIFWHAPGYTWSPALQSADLPETSADLSLPLRDTCPGVLTIRFTLFLDLDGDNLAESVLSSTQALPAGRMLFGNAFTPGYSGSDTLDYDNRLLADSLKFRFAIEKQQSGDTIRAFLRWTTGQTPVAYYAPRLPEGKHRILWTVERNGLQVAFCEQAFRVKDCMEPQISCIDSWNASLPSSDTLWLTAADVLKMASDNITPNNLLAFGLRRPGASGMGFPVNNFGAPITKLPFTCADLGPQTVELWTRDLSDNNNLCIGEFVLYDFLKRCDVVDPIVCATTVFVNNDTIQNVRYELETIVEQGLPPVYLSHTPLPNGCVELPDFSPYLIETVAITPKKNDDPLNGVSTFDLVLINRHILGVQLFNKTWKYLAADANNSGTLTTFDIIELRKLILGIYDSLPNSSSWKFYIADCTLDSINPFKLVCPGILVFDPEVPPKQYLFMGIKTGDVNGNASSNILANESRPRSPALLRMPDQYLAAGASFDVFVTTAAPVEWIGYQAALRWDPDVLEISSVEPVQHAGSAQTACHFPEPGLLRFNWFDSEAQWWLPEQPILRLQGKAKTGLRLSTALQLDPTGLFSEAYRATGEAIPLGLGFDFNLKPTTLGTAIYPPQPNPTPEGAIFPINLEKPAIGTLELWDAAGQLAFESQTALEAGAGKMEIPAAALLPPGVYAWRIQVGQLTKTGRLIRL